MKRSSCIWCGGPLPTPPWFAGTDTERREPCCSLNCALENEGTWADPKYRSEYDPYYAVQP